MKILLNKAHHPVTVLGPGRRIGLWLQGCTIRCPGCVSLDTWAADPATAIEVADVLDWCAGLPADDVDGVTISGGEPFDQPAALHELLRGLHDWRDRHDREVDLLCYSGRQLSALRRGFAAELRLLDAVVPGPYLRGRAGGQIWRGSANQSLVPLTPLGHRRYDEATTAADDRPRLQVTVDDEAIWYVGIPRPGDLERLDAALAARGVTQAEVSWRS